MTTLYYIINNTTVSFTLISGVCLQFLLKSIQTYLKYATILFGILNTNFMASCRLLMTCLSEVTLWLNSANLLLKLWKSIVLWKKKHNYSISLCMRAFSVEIIFCKQDVPCKLTTAEDNLNANNSNSLLTRTKFPFPWSKFHWNLPHNLNSLLTRTVFCFPSEFGLLGFYCIYFY